MKTGCDHLRQSRLGKQIARQLFNGELVKCHIRIERIDNPVPVGPHRPWRVDRVPVGIRVPGLIQPVTSPTLPEMRTCQHAVNHSLVGIGTRIGNIVSYFIRIRQQAEQVERETSIEGLAIRFACRLQVISLEPICNETIDRRIRPFLIGR